MTAPKWHRFVQVSNREVHYYQYPLAPPGGRENGENCAKQKKSVHRLVTRHNSSTFASQLQCLGASIKIWWQHARCFYDPPGYDGPEICDQPLPEFRAGVVTNLQHRRYCRCFFFISISRAGIFLLFEGGMDFIFCCSPCWGWEGAIFSASFRLFYDFEMRKLIDWLMTRGERNLCSSTDFVAGDYLWSVWWRGGRCENATLKVWLAEGFDKFSTIFEYFNYLP